MTEGEVPGERPRQLFFLPRFLFKPERPLAYILKAWPLALLPSLALGLIANRFAPPASAPFGDAERIPAAFLFVMLVVVGPFLETLIMAAVATVLNRAWGLATAAVVSALLWGVAHGLVAPLWGMVVWWPFLILTIAFLTWRPRGLWLAIGVAAAIHALQNVVAGAGLVFG